MILYEFPHSHFCEVARWALDHKGLPYESRCLLPGWHAVKMKRIAAQSHLPVLEHDGTVVQDSAAIVDYLERLRPEPSLAASRDAGEVRAFEAGVARDIGVPLRRLCYWHLLPYPDLVRYFFMHRSGLLERTVFRLAYPRLEARLRAAYDITESGAARARDELERAIERYDSLLDGREYFFGDRFTRADLTFAALLVFMVMPPAYPVPWPEQLAGLELTEWFRRFAGSASYRHVERCYARHRAGIDRPRDAMAS